MSSNIAVIMIIIVIFITAEQQKRIRLLAVQKLRRGGKKMTNELIKNYIGKECVITSGSFGSVIKGEIISVADNWIEIKTKRGNQLQNADYVTNIAITK